METNAAAELPDNNYNTIEGSRPPSRYNNKPISNAQNSKRGISAGASGSRSRNRESRSRSRNQNVTGGGMIKG